MPDTTTPLIQLSTMAPFAHAIDRAGLSAIDLGGPVGITPEMFADPRSVAPAQSIYRFAEMAAEVLKEPHLGVKLGLEPEAVQWPVIAGAFAESRVLVEFFSRFLLESQRYTTKVEFRLELGADVSWFVRDRGFTPSVPPSQIDGFAVGLFVNLFRFALGQAWNPSAVLFKIYDPEAARIPETGNCNIISGDARTLSFSFPSEWLVLPIRRQNDANLGRKARKPPSDALVDAIRSNIRSNLSDPEYGVPKLVAQMGIDRRNVQKYLRERGSGLADLIADERKKLGCSLLESGAYTLEEVSHALGYTDVSNFSRAFRRWTGVAPSRWTGSAR